MFRENCLFRVLLAVTVVFSCTDAFGSLPFFGVTTKAKNSLSATSTISDRTGLSSILRYGTFALFSTAGNGNAEDDGTSEEGADLAAEFFKMAQQKGVELESEDLMLDDDDEDEEDLDDDDDEDDDEDVANIPQGAINAFLGYDTGDVGEKLAGNVSLTDDQLYSEVKERVLDTAGGFVDYVKRARDDEDDDEDYDDPSEPKAYEPPTTVPDPELTAGEVVILILKALANNDNPTKNRGVEILFGYSSPASQIKNEEGLTPGEYAEFLQGTEYKVLFDPESVSSIEKADYSFDGKKAFFTARLQVNAADVVNVNFILSSSSRRFAEAEGDGDDDSCWLVDSMLIRPQSMRRRRRK